MKNIWKRLLPGMLAMALLITGLPMQQVFAVEDSGSNLEVSEEDTDQEPETLMGNDEEEDTEIPENTSQQQEEADDITSSDVTEEYLLNYVVIEKPYVETPGTQKVVVSIGEEDITYQNAILVYQNADTGTTYEKDADTIDGNTLLFAIEHDQDEMAAYALTEVRFTIDGQQGAITLAECGMDVRYGVNKELESSTADAVITEVKENSSELNITMTDAEGNTISEDSLGDALEKAERQVAGTPALFSMENRDSGSAAKSSGLVVVVDPGHDSRHAGASYHGVNEQDLTLKIAKYLKEELDTYENVEVYLTRETASCAWGAVDTSTCLNNRAKFAAEKDADIFVSIHLNADDGSGRAYGAEVYYPNPKYRPELSTTGGELAEVILEKLGDLGIHERGTQYQYVSDDDPKYDLPDGSRGDKYAVIRETKKLGIPGLIVEHAFLSNLGDYDNYLNSDEKLKKLGVADATAIAEYYGLEKELQYKWTLMGSGSYKIGQNAQFYYAVNKPATITVQMYYGDNSYMRTLVSNKSVQTNDQVVSWDLKDANGNYVENGTYRFTITAVNEKGITVTAHKWFQVTGNDPLSFRWTTLGSGSYKIGQNAQLYYAVNKPATITVQMYYGDNSYMRTLVSNKSVQTNDQVISWDLKDANGNYVENGTYRFTITAKEANGRTVTAHNWFQVTGNDPLSFKWTTLGSGSYKIGQNAQLYYAVNKPATVTVQMYYGDNSYMRTLVSNKSVQTNDQVVSWDLKDANGNYVENGTYRFTITAKEANGRTVTAHKWFQVTGNDPLSFKWTTLSSGSYKIGQNAQLYYAVNKPATITVQMYYGDNSYMRTLVSNKSVQTNDQVISWDLKDANGNYVENGTYRFTITAKEANGRTVTAHNWFQVTGNPPLSFQSVRMKSDEVEGATSAELYFSTNKSATVTVEVYYGNNSFLKTLVPDKQVGTDEQTVVWDLKDSNQKYVDAGLYRFTVTATDGAGKKVVSHQYFHINYVSIMGESQTTVDKMAAFYTDRYVYPEFYKDTEAPTIEDFCRIYFEECEKEGVRAEVAFSQAMKETGFLQYRGDAKIEQFNFAGLDTTGAILPDGTVDVGRSYSGVREGVRAHIQRLKAYAVKGTTPESFVEQCVDADKFDSSWWCETIVGCSPYVEWLGKEQNPSGFGWATDPNYGFSIKNDYLAKLMNY